MSTELRSLQDAPTAAELFAIVWRELAALLGTSATAALVRRAVRRAARVEPALAELVVERDGLEYGFTLPRRWASDRGEAARAQLRALVRGELHVLLTELTGKVVTSRLARVPELRDTGLAGQEEDA